MDEFWRDRLPDSREGTCWRHVLETLTVYRLIDPGSEWRLHRQWFQNSAMADLLEEDFSLAEKNALYMCIRDRCCCSNDNDWNDATHGCGPTKNAEPPLTRDANRNREPDRANGGELRRFVRQHRHRVVSLVY